MKAAVIASQSVVSSIDEGWQSPGVSSCSRARWASGHGTWSWVGSGEWLESWPWSWSLTRSVTWWEMWSWSKVERRRE